MHALGVYILKQKYHEQPKFPSKASSGFHNLKKENKSPNILNMTGQISTIIVKISSYK